MQQISNQRLCHYLENTIACAKVQKWGLKGNAQLGANKETEKEKNNSIRR
jgi:hypothetical protein